MRTGAQIFALALAGALAGSSAPLHAAESWSAVKMKPLGAASWDEGGKHILTYFQKDAGVCRLTLMIEESVRSGAPETRPSRVVAEIAAGKAADFDTVEGKRLNFSCGENAQSMQAAELDRLAFNLSEE